MLTVYSLGVLALKSSYVNEAMANKFATVLALVGSVNIPIIYYAAEFFNTLHQTTGTSFGSASMAIPFFVMLAAGYCFYGWVLLRAIRAEVLVREAKTQWVKDLIAARAV